MRLSSPAVGLEIEGGRILAVHIRRDGETTRVPADQVVFNGGPRALVALAGEAHFTPDHVRRTRELLKPAANLTATCPELAPEGWRQYVAYAVPRPAIGDFDSAAEVENGLKDLRQQFPGFDDIAKILSIRVMRDEWPAQRSGAGYDMEQETGIAGLWCVGDAVKLYGNGGAQPCAETAKVVMDRIVEARRQTARA